VIGGNSNIDAVLADFTARTERLADLQPPLLRAGIIVRDASVMRIKAQGGDQPWIPNKRGGHTGILTGRMMNSIQVAPPTQDAVTVGTNVPYARWFQEGTGIFAGHTPWTVTAKNKQSLAFTMGGVTYLRRSVTIPGEPQRPYLYVDDKNRGDILKEFVDYLTGKTNP
jgi:phage gpG-like protein